MRLNYLEMLDKIKMDIFSGDHSGLYMLACAVACICACISLLWWYNKMLNDPFGQLDVRAIIRSLAILALTCNFYSFVLIPFDYMTSLVTRGITAYVDNDESGITGKINALMADVEKAQQEKTLLGKFKVMIESEIADTTETSGMSFGTSSIMESQAEADLDAGGQKSFWTKILETIKIAATSVLGTPVTNTSTLLSWLISLLVKIVQYVLLAVSSVYLIVLGLVGPFSFALALMPGFTGNISNWIARYIQISFWIPMSAFVDFVNFRMKDSMIDFFNSSTDFWTLLAPTHLVIMDIVTIICLLAIPNMCSWVISGSGAGGIASAAVNTAAKAFMLKK